MTVSGVPNEPTAIASPYCPLYQAAVELIGRRWTGAIIRAMLFGSMRFTDIMSKVPGLSDRLLSERLRELEGHGIVRRTVYPETPVRVEYSLTEKGRELQSIVAELSEWAERWAALEEAAAAQHKN
jgi:DNA-binding HxlR family transcriptional regulator